MRRKTKSFISLMIVVLLVCLTACSSNKPEQKNNSSQPVNHKEEEIQYEGKVVVWTWEEIDSYKETIQAFNEQYSDIEVEFVMVADTDIPQKLQATVASGGKLPDIIKIESNQRAKVLNMDILDDLTQAPYHFDPSLIFDYNLPNITFNDKIVAVPIDVAVAGLAYNKKLAREYLGTDNPAELEAMLTDWDTFISIGKEVLEKSNGDIKMLPGLLDVYTIISSQRSEPYFDGDNFNSATMTSVLDRVIQFRDSGIVDHLDTFTPAWMSSITTDKYLFYPNAVWMQYFIFGPVDQADDRWGLMVPPGGGFEYGGSFNGIPKDAENKELAWKFLEFISLTSDGAYALKKDGVFTHLKEVYDNPEFTNWTWRNFGEQNIGEKFFNVIAPNANSVFKSFNDTLITDMRPAIIQAIQNDQSVTSEKVLELIASELKAKNSNISVQ